MPYNVFGGTLNHAQFNAVDTFMFCCSVDLPWSFASWKCVHVCVLY